MTTTSEAALDELQHAILRRVTPILTTAGISGDAAACRVAPEQARLEVQFDLPIAVSPAVRQALTVRVLDAVRGADRTYGSVHVTVHTPG